MVKAFNGNKCCRHRRFTFKEAINIQKSHKGLGMMAGAGLVNDHMGAAGWEGGTCGVPCSPATLILSGDLTKRRTSCHSRRSFDVPTTSESRLVFVHNEDCWLC